MKNYDKYYELLNKESLSSEERELLENEVGNMDDFTQLSSHIEQAVKNENLEPSHRIKQNLDAEFERKFGSRKVKHQGIIPLNNWSKQKPWSVFAAAASITIVLFLSVQLGFKGFDQNQDHSPYLADSVTQQMPDSNYWPSDTLIAPF
jgi:anti-sigma-K factor RskA